MAVFKRGDNLVNSIKFLIRTFEIVRNISYSNQKFWSCGRILICMLNIFSAAFKFIC